MCEPGHTVSYIEPHRTSLVWTIFFKVSAARYGGIPRDTAGYCGILGDTGRCREIRDTGRYRGRGEKIREAALRKHGREGLLLRSRACAGLLVAFFYSLLASRSRPTR